MRARLLVVTGALLAASAAWGSPIVSLDAAPGVAGIQDYREVTIGSSFQVDLVISDVSALDPLESFDVQLAFDPLVLQALDVAGGDFLLDPVVTFEEVIGVSTVDLAELSLGGGASGQGVLASFTFEAVALGDGALDLPAVLLGGAFGDPIPVGEIRGARIAVTPVPEPGAAMLFGVGGMLIARRAGSGRRPT